MRRVALIAAGATALALSSCSTHNLDFVQDDRISIRTPADGERVRLPLELHWESDDFRGLFAVFFDDATPMRPGETLLSLVGADDPCRRTSDCPDEEWLSSRNIFVTRDTSLVVERLPERRGSGSERETHEVVIVLLDDSGRRTSEATFHREFSVERER